MNRNDINWGTGKVTYWELEDLLEDKPMGEQYEILKEDLAQITFGDTLLDVGWYPEFSPDGRFVVTVVADQDWDSPVLRLECREASRLRDTIALAVDAAQRADM